MTQLYLCELPTALSHQLATTASDFSLAVQTVTLSALKANRKTLTSDDWVLMGATQWAQQTWLSDKTTPCSVIVIHDSETLEAPALPNQPGPGESVKAHWVFPAASINLTLTLFCARIATTQPPSHEAVPPPISAHQLKQALAQDQLRLVYQPQFDLATQKLLGFEAFARLNAGPDQWFLPGQFIPTAQMHHLNQPLIEKIIERALGHFLTLSQDNLTLSINLSAEDLMAEATPQWLKNAIEQKALSQRTIFLQITDTTAFESLSQLVTRLQAFQACGFHLSLEKIGTGWAQPAFFDQLPIDEIKLDPGLLSAMTYPTTQAALADLIHQAQSHQLGVVAQGIESKAQAQQLKRLGVEIGQGYYYARPMLFRRVPDFLARLNTQTTATPKKTPTQPTPAPASPKNQPSVSKKTLQLASVLPLSGLFSMVGHSQQFGIECAQQAWHAKAYASASWDVNWTYHDDDSDPEQMLALLKHCQHNDCLALVSGALYTPDIDALLALSQTSDLPIVAPFNGHCQLRHPEATAFYHLKPSFEQELLAIIEQIQFDQAPTVFVFAHPGSYQRLSKHVTGHRHFHALPMTPQKLQRLVQKLHQTPPKHLVFLGTAKELTTLIRECKDVPIHFWTTSMVGTEALKNEITAYQKPHLTLVSAMPTWQAGEKAGQRFYAQAQQHPSENPESWINPISFESFLAAELVLSQLSPDIDRFELKRRFEKINGWDIGFPYPLTWDASQRQWLHHCFTQILF